MQIIVGFLVQAVLSLLVFFATQHFFENSILGFLIAGSFSLLLALAIGFYFFSKYPKATEKGH
jgi:hypothetical protein